MRIVVIVSEDSSDIYFANQMLKKLKVVGVVVENKKAAPGISVRLKKAFKFLNAPIDFIKKVIDEFQTKYFDAKALKVHKKGFGKDGEYITVCGNCQILYTMGESSLSDEKVVGQIKEWNPDLIVVCGASVLSNEIISIASKGVINLHGGLSQRYRGVWTTLWAIYNSEPEYIGATVHYIDSGIDTGNIIYQGRPNLTGNDNPESAYVKVVKTGIEMVFQAVKEISEGNCSQQKLRSVGKLYTRSMINVDVIRCAWQKCKNGIICEYLSDKQERDKKVQEIIKETHFKLKDES